VIPTKNVFLVGFVEGYLVIFPTRIIPPLEGIDLSTIAEAQIGEYIGWCPIPSTF